MNENNTMTVTAVKVSLETANTVRKKIGNTTYIATSSFNGNKNRDMASAFIRLIERDSSLISS